MAKEILIADSDKSDQKEFQKIFETTNYHLTFSENGEDALLRTKLFKPDMIIASAGGLQEMGGEEFCGAIKKEPDFEHVPFILISNVFDGISEQDRQRVGADGVISKPLNEDEVLNLVDHLLEEEVGKGEGMIPGKRELVLDEIGDGDEEIIELLEVVEEPEAKMSIDDLVASQKEEPTGEIGPLDSWEKFEFDEKPAEPQSAFVSGKATGETNRELKKEKPVKETLPGDELFEKIELEEILEKVEQLKPSLEKEWPAQTEVRDVNERVFEAEKPSEKEFALSIEELPEVPLDVSTQPPVEKHFDLSEFEAALQREVEAAPSEPKLAPISETSLGPANAASVTEFIGEPEKKIPEDVAPEEVSAEEEELAELPEEEFPDEFLEEILGEDEISAIDEPKELIPEPEAPKEIRTSAVRTSSVVTEALQTDPLEDFKPGIFEREEAGLITAMDRPAEVTALSQLVDKHLEEVLAKGVQEMVGDFITKILPEMTQNIIGLTAERIEKMVKEIVPDMAEKAIHEEIKRLQKEEKD